MQNTFKRVAMGLLSLVFCVGLLVPAALAVGGGFEDSVAPHSDRCDFCWGVGQLHHELAGRPGEGVRDEMRAFRAWNGFNGLQRGNLL